MVFGVIDAFIKRLFTNIIIVIIVNLMRTIIATIDNLVL